jgi:hypothetical protein
MAGKALRRSFSHVLFGVLLSVVFSANAAIKQCERLTPDQQTQADFCDAHMPCRVAISLLSSCADVTTALRRFHDELNAPKPIPPNPAGSKPGQSERPQDNVDKLTGTERSAALERDELRQFQADDRLLENEMLDANCTVVALAEQAQCERLAVKAFELKQRLDRFERDAASRTAGNEQPLVMPVLLSWKKIRTDRDGATRYVIDGVSASAASADVADAPPLAPAMPMRPRSAVHTFFREAIASAETEGKSLRPSEADVRAQADAGERVSAAVTAASEQAALVERQQTMRNGDVGEVYALADRLESEQQPAAAREAFRAVIARFPDHLLASSAVTRLSVVSATSSVPAANREKKGNPPDRIVAKVPADCDSQATALNAEMARLNARKPANASSIAMLQMVMYISSKSLSLGKGICSGNRRRYELTNGMQAVFNDARRTCANISAKAKASNAACVARAPAW